MKIREGMPRSEVESECLEMLGRYNRREHSNVDLYMLFCVDLSIAPLSPGLQKIICRDFIENY